MKTFLVTLIVSLSALVGVKASAADEVFWSKLQPRFNYSDLKLSCSGPSRNIYVVARVSGGKVIKAELRDGEDYFLSNIVFNASELSGIVAEKDAVGDYWVTTLPLSTRLLAWAIYNMDYGTVGACGPLTAMATIAPGEVTYKFKPKSASEFITPQSRFTGKLRDGSFYEIKLGFSQYVIGIN